MKLANNLKKRPARHRLIAFFLSVPLLLAMAAHAQSPQLSLADLLIGLRSKKVTLPERNKILSEAIRQRGITFSMTPEIEKELVTTGADTELLTAIRQKTTVAVPTPAPTPAPPDFSFYQKRADENIDKGEFALALADYNKAVEMKSDQFALYLARGKTHYNMKSYDLSVADYDRALELSPKESNVFFNRGVALEKLSDVKKAAADYQKAIDLDPANEAAKASLKRLQDETAKEAAKETAKAAAKVQPVAPPPLVVEPVKPPEFINLGGLSAANATKMVTPVYSPIAQRSNVEGKVVVEVQLDENGEVTAVKATTGHQMLRGSAEDAARRSKFKPAMFNGKPIKAIGAITYNFSLRPGRE